MSNPSPLSREILAKFLPNQEAIRTFEQLIAMAGTTLPDSIVIINLLLDELTVSLGTTDAKAEQALSLLTSIDQSLQLLANAPLAPTEAIAVLARRVQDLEAAPAWDYAGSAAAVYIAATSSFQPLDSDLTAIAALTTTAYGRSFLTQANAAAARSLMGLGSAALNNTGDFDAAGAAAAAQAASQPLDSDLTAIAALTTTAFGRAFLTLADAAASRAVVLSGNPAFLAYNAANVNNVTGAGTLYTVAFGTEVFDTGVFAANTFTCGVAGRYQLSAQVSINDLTAAMTFIRLEIVTSNRTYVSIHNSTNATTQFQYSMSIDVLADMDAADTAVVKITVANGAGDTVDLVGSSELLTFFSGVLVSIP